MNGTEVLNGIDRWSVGDRQMPIFEPGGFFFWIERNYLAPN